jgi:DNA polymerase V
MDSDKENIVFCQIDQNSLKEIPIYEGGVSAGFPSPADDYLDIDLNLHQHLVKHPSSTFFVIAKGNSMHDSGIHNNDLLVVDKSLDARNNDIIIAALNGEFLVKRYLLKNNKVYLRAENELESYPTITITEDMDFEVWGIVTHTIHSNR